jgi:hypothetical protein
MKYRLVDWQQIYIYIRLKIKPNSVRIRFLSCQIFVLPLTGLKSEKFTGPNKVLLVLGWKTGVHHEDYAWYIQVKFQANLLGIDVRHVYKRV